MQALMFLLLWKLLVLLKPNDGEEPEAFGERKQKACVDLSPVLSKWCPCLLYTLCMPCVCFQWTSLSFKKRPVFKLTCLVAVWLWTGICSFSTLALLAFHFCDALIPFQSASGS